MTFLVVVGTLTCLKFLVYPFSFADDSEFFLGLLMGDLVIVSFECDLGIFRMLLFDKDRN